MSVQIRPARGGKGWEYDIRIRWPEGGRHRERANAPTSSKSASLRWAQAREATLLAAGKAALDAPAAEPAEVVTFGAFWPRVVSDHYEANRKKASTVDAAKTIYRVHLSPVLDAKSLESISNADVATIKGRLKDHGPKTVNNVLSVLSRAMKCAVEWGLIVGLPCKIGLLRVPEAERDWYEVEEYRRLVDAARGIGASWLVLVLLAGSAGLRRGEVRALRWTDVDIARAVLRIKKATWRAVEGTTKGGRWRDVPMTPELAAALTKHRHLKGERVLYSLNGKPISNRSIRNWMARVQRHAGLEANGGIHLLRHTFCSHLAAAGVPAKAIQELAGHADLKTTMRYMHLAPADKNTAVIALESYYAAGSNGGASLSALRPVA